MSDVAKSDLQAAAALLPQVYDELRKLAASWLARERPGQTLDATGLVHEAYLRLIGPADADRWANRGHFFAAAAEAMRRILVEAARRKGRVKHGGGRQRIDLANFELSADGTPDEFLDLDDALTRLAAEEPQVAEVVKLRYFAGLTVEQTAAVLGLSVRTANRHWAYARAWLFEDMNAQT